MTCPICKKPAFERFRPFCSKRCADLDLGKWLNGAYSVPSASQDDIENALEQIEHKPSRLH